MKRSRKIILREFQCPACGKRLVVPKKGSQATEDGHFKDMYCPFCKERQHFMQLSHEFTRT